MTMSDQVLFVLTVVGVICLAAGCLMIGYHLGRRNTTKAYIAAEHRHRQILDLSDRPVPRSNGESRIKDVRWKL